MFTPLQKKGFNGGLVFEFLSNVIWKIWGVFSCLAGESIALPLRKLPDARQSNEPWFSGSKNVAEKSDIQRATRRTPFLGDPEATFT